MCAFLIDWVMPPAAVSRGALRFANRQSRVTVHGCFQCCSEDWEIESVRAACCQFTRQLHYSSESDILPCRIVSLQCILQNQPPQCGCGACALVVNSPVETAIGSEWSPPRMLLRAAYCLLPTCSNCTGSRGDRSECETG